VAFVFPMFCGGFKGTPPRLNDLAPVAPKNAVMAYTFCETFLLVSFNTFFGVNNQLAGYI